MDEFSSSDGNSSAAFFFFTEERSHAAAKHPETEYPAGSSLNCQIDSSLFAEPALLVHVAAHSRLGMDVRLAIFQPFSQTQN